MKNSKFPKRDKKLKNMTSTTKYQNDNSIWCSQAVTHPSTNQTQRCLTSLIGREAVFSTWYGRSREYTKK